MTAFCFNVCFTQHPNFAGIRLLVPSRVGTLFLPYTAALEGERKNNCMSKSNLKWSCTISESTLLVRDVDIYLRKSNLEAFTSFFFFFTGTWVCRYLLSRSVFLRAWLKLRSVSRGGLRMKARFSPRIPFSLMSWNTVLISDYMWHHKTTHISIVWIVKVQTICFQRRSFSLAAQVLDLSSPAEPSHMNPKWKKCVSPVFTTSQWPVFFHCLGSPIWVCPLHHGCLFPITAEITTMFTTHRRRSRHINSLHIAAKRSSFFLLWLQ